MGLIQIPFGVDLLQEVADHIETFPPEERGRIRVLLPHRRACRRLRMLLGGQTQILPRISPLGEPDTAEFSIDDAEILPEVSSQTRWLLLTWLLRHARAVDSSNGTAEQDSLLAHSLGQAMDRLGEFDHSLADLQVPEHGDLAEHWGRLSEFMRVVRDFWPSWCAENGCLDPIARRNAVLRKLSEDIDAPIIIAGSSGRAVAVQYLMQAVLAAPKGWVYLQGLEVVSDTELLGSVPSHPGYALARLCRFLDFTPETHENFYRAVFRSRTEAVTFTQEPPKNIQALILPDRGSEVGVTALLVREALEHQESENVAVICQDADFVDSLERWLTRWNIAVDRVAGLPIRRTPEGRLMCLILDIWCKGLDWVRLMALLKHPLVCLGMTRSALAKCTRGLEFLALNGYSERSVEQAFSRSAEPDFAWLKSLEVLYQPPEERSFHDFTIFWFRVFEGLCENADAALPNSGAMQVMGQWQESITVAGEYLGETPIEIIDFVGMALPMFAQMRVPPPPRGRYAVSVLSAMEARLMRFDRVIIPMMNYGILPMPPTPEPWLTRQQYQDCAMPPPEETVGLAAHDFIELCHQPEVFLLRADKIGDEVVGASLWWDRLDALHLMTRGWSMVDTEENARWQKYLDATLTPDQNPTAGRPSPNPPKDKRAQKLSVTKIQALFCNPYELYVQQILKLEERPVRTSETFAARRGTLLHQLVQDFVSATPQNPLDWLMQRTEDLIKEQDFIGLEALNVRYGVARMMQRFCDQEQKFSGLENRLEVMGQWEVSGVQIRGRADRLLLDREGVRILDYKSGSFPAAKSLLLRYEWQLPVLALMVRAGAFGTTKAIVDVGYWSIGGSKNDRLQWLLPKLMNDGGEDFLADVSLQLSQRLSEMQQSDAAFPALPDPECLPSFLAFDHLTRAEEWLEQPTESEDEDDEA